MSTEPPPRVRRAAAVDEEALCTLEQRVFCGDRLSRAQFRRHLDSDTALVLVSTDHGKLLGDAVLFFRRGSTVVRLYSLVAAPEARGRGVGRALLAAAERHARRRGRELRLEVRVDNTAAIALYESAGYQRFGQRAAYYEDGCDAWRYRKTLD
ncbi:MAG TPA: N-acetyltransferase [Rhodanobacteraceae bacterium]|nr:N-acetyltransferase [Rhodanobacteraceae bacterium]